MGQFIHQVKSDIMPSSIIFGTGIPKTGDDKTVLIHIIHTHQKKKIRKGIPLSDFLELTTYVYRRFAEKQEIENY